MFICEVYEIIEPGRWRFHFLLGISDPLCGNFIQMSIKMESNDTEISNRENRKNKEDIHPFPLPSYTTINSLQILIFKSHKKMMFPEQYSQKLVKSQQPVRDFPQLINH